MRVAKSRVVRPVIKKILGVGNSVEVQASILRAIIDHPKLAFARAIVGVAMVVFYVFVLFTVTVAIAVAVTVAVALAIAIAIAIFCFFNK